MKIAIMTWTVWENIGTHLQAYAIQSIVSLMGHDVKLVNYDFVHKAKREKIKDIISRILTRFYFLVPDILKLRFHLDFYYFRYRYFKYTKKVNENSIKNLNNEFDAFICGSDQIWNPQHFNDLFLLSFVNESKRKVSYAPSIGVTLIPTFLHDIYKRLISRIDYVSIREKAGAAVLDKMGIPSQIVIDPTLLLSKDDWERIENKKNSIKSEYLFCYFLNYSDDFFPKIQNLAKKLNLQILLLSRTRPKSPSGILWFEEIPPTYFLTLIHHAKLVITDSYHGAIFSIIFQKEFLLYQRFDINDPFSENSRIEQLLDMFDLRRCLIVDFNTSLAKVPIDYLKVSILLKQWQTKSVDFLKKALCTENNAN